MAAANGLSDFFKAFPTDPVFFLRPGSPNGRGAVRKLLRAMTLAEADGYLADHRRTRAKPELREIKALRKLVKVMKASKADPTTIIGDWADIEAKTGAAREAPHPSTHHLPTVL